MNHPHARRRSTCVRVAAILALLAAAPAVAQPEAVDGVVVAGYDTTLAFPIGGVVREVNVQAGDRVEAGTPLARLDDRAASAEVELLRLEAESDLGIRLAEQRLELARVSDVQANRNSAAVVREGDPKSAVGLRLAELELERQRLLQQQARRQHELARVRHEQHALAAPIAGVVERILVSPGQHVAPGQPVARIVNADELFVEAQVPSDLASGLRAGRPVTVRPRAASSEDAARPVPGVVTYVSQSIDPQTDSRFARIKLDGAPALPPGAAVSIDVTPEP